MKRIKKQTAVEWLIENLISEPYSEQDFEHNFQCWEQAKAMEKEQSHEYAEFAIRCDRMDMKILNFENYLKLETFKSE